jgi:hypothetical protein
MVNAVAIPPAPAPTTMIGYSVKDREDKSKTTYMLIYIILSIMSHATKSLHDSLHHFT